MTTLARLSRAYPNVRTAIGWHRSATQDSSSSPDDPTCPAETICTKRTALRTTKLTESATAALHVDEFADLYIGRYDSPAAFAEEMWDDLGFDAAINKVVPEAQRYYVTVDFDGMARDMRLGGEVEFYEAGGDGVYVFRTG